MTPTEQQAFDALLADRKELTASLEALGGLMKALQGDTCPPGCIEHICFEFIRTVKANHNKATFTHAVLLLSGDEESNVLAALHYPSGHTQCAAKMLAISAAIVIDQLPQDDSSGEVLH